MITISPRELIRPEEVSRIYYGYRRYACGHPVPKGGIFMKQRLSRILPFTLFPAIALGIGWLSSTLTRYGLEQSIGCTALPGCAVPGSPSRDSAVLLRKPCGFLASAALSAVAALRRLSERRGMASEPLTEQKNPPLISSIRGGFFLVCLMLLTQAAEAGWMHPTPPQTCGARASRPDAIPHAGQWRKAPRG